LRAADVTRSTRWPRRLAKLPLKADELEEANRAVELYEQINIAVLASLVPGERPEQREADDAEGLQGRAALAQRL